MRRRDPVWTYGIPFLLFMAGGSFALSHFTQVRIDRQDRKSKMLTTREVLDLEGDERLHELKQEYEVGI